VTSRSAGARRGDVLAADEDPPAIGRLEAGDETQRRRLAGAARPEQDDEFAARDSERELVDRRHRAEALAAPSRRSSAMARLATQRQRTAARLVEQRHRARVEHQADVVAALCARLGPTLARSVEPTAVVTVTIWL
jgi:hypothetical protein